MTAWEKQEFELRTKFAQLRPFLEIWGRLVDKKILQLLKKAKEFELYDIKIKPKFRVKDEISFIRKALKRGKQYSDPLLQINDKIGTRIVVLTNDHISLVRDVILKENKFWEARLDRDIRTDKLKSPLTFDYLACHIVITPKKNNKLPEELLRFLTCEIQIKTLFQHAYSEIGHDTVYKGPYKHEPQLLRILAKSMAMMEATDEYFCEMYNKVKKGDLFSINFLRKLEDLFLKFKPDYNPRSLDPELTDSIFNIKDINYINIDKVQDLAYKHENDIKNIVQLKNFILSDQPTILLLIYYIYYLQDTLIEGWEFQRDILDELAFRVGKGLPR